MLVNLVEKGNIPLVEDALLRTLKQIFVGDDLWLGIDTVTLDFGVEGDDAPVTVLEVRYGRSGDRQDLNFCDTARISLDDSEVDLQFLCGRFFQYVDSADIKFGNVDK